MGCRPFPQDQVEHELRSFRYHLMAHPQCPPIVRLRTREATFSRPSIDLVHVTSSPSDNGRHRLAVMRTINILWWSEMTDETAAASAQAQTDWLVKVLVKGGDQRLSVFRVYDWSTDEPLSLNTFMNVDVDSIDVRPVPDEYGFWMCACDFRYEVDVAWPLEVVVPVTEIVTTQLVVPVDVTTVE